MCRLIEIVLLLRQKEKGSERERDGMIIFIQGEKLRKARHID